MGGLIKRNYLWLTVYPRAWRDWRKMRKQYSGLKVSQQELIAIQKAMDAPLMPAGN
jgi:hypothetical protein